MGPAAVRGGRSPPHATPAFLRAPRDARAPARRRCSSPTSATDSRHVHQTNRSIPRVAPRSRAAPRPMERMPQQTTRVVMRLTAHPELRSIHVSRAPPIRRVRTPPDPAEPSIEKSGLTGGAPRARRCLPRTGRACRPLTPPSRRTRGRSLIARRQDRLPRHLVKGDGSVRPRAPSLDECLLGPRAFTR